MPIRAPRRTRRTELPDMGDELRYGPYGDFRRQCARCARREQLQDLPPFDHGRDCGCSRPPRFQTALAGFHPEDDTACLSRYTTPEDREASWHEHGEEILTGSRRKGVDPPWALGVYGPL